MSKHTEGPWKVFDPQDRESNYGVDGANGEAVVFYGETSNNGIPSLADAQLIAASLDLYDAADAALNALIGCCVAGDGVDDRKTMLEAQKMLRAALAKANGG